VLAGAAAKVFSDYDCFGTAAKRLRKNSIPKIKTFRLRKLRCGMRSRERAGLAGPRSEQDTIHAALKAPLFHGSRRFRSARQLTAKAIPRVIRVFPQPLQSHT
jgi:hypothetical protein